MIPPLLLAALPASATVITLTLLGASAPEQGLQITQSRAIAAPPAAVWAVIGAFCDLPRGHRRVRSCTSSHDAGRTVRVLDISGVGSLAEVQLDRDDADMSYSYTLERGPWPIRQYRAELAVSPQGAGAFVTWRATFRLRGASDEGAVADIEEMFRAGLANLAREVSR